MLLVSIFDSQRVCLSLVIYFSSFFFFNDTATTEIYTLSLHDALPILVVLLPFQLLRLSLATPSRWTPLALSVLKESPAITRSEERFSRNAETDLVCRLLLEKKKKINKKYRTRSL